MRSSDGRTDRTLGPPRSRVRHGRADRGGPRRGPRGDPAPRRPGVHRDPARVGPGATRGPPPIEGAVRAGDVGRRAVPRGRRTPGDLWRDRRDDGALPGQRDRRSPALDDQVGEDVLRDARARCARRRGRGVARRARSARQEGTGAHGRSGPPGRPDHRRDPRGDHHGHHAHLLLAPRARPPPAVRAGLPAPRPARWDGARHGTTSRRCWGAGSALSSY